MQQPGDAQQEMGELPGSRTDFPARTVLKPMHGLHCLCVSQISKDLVDLQIETNRMKERYETENFQLKTTVPLWEQPLPLLLESDSQREPFPRESDTCAPACALAGSRHHSCLPSHSRPSPMPRCCRPAGFLCQCQVLQASRVSVCPAQVLQASRVSVCPAQVLQASRVSVCPAQVLQASRVSLCPAQVLLSSRLQELEAENARLQLQLKELNEEYRCRLAQCLGDLAVGHSKAPAGHAAMQNFVDSMLRDIQASYRRREEQLARAARGYRKPPPPQASWKSPTAGSPAPGGGRQGSQVEQRVWNAHLSPCSWQSSIKLPPAARQAALGPMELQLDEEGWAEVKRKLREFTLNTQEELEQQRSQLLTRAVVAEEQVLELQGYIDQHLTRACPPSQGTIPNSQYPNIHPCPLAVGAIPCGLSLYAIAQSPSPTLLEPL
uniref:DUF4472 domain-containing protein n=1 Tax=Geospiza parvula TaxID=87175 RepID=A0A8U8BPW4_GEOPR